MPEERQHEQYMTLCLTLMAASMRAAADSRKKAVTSAARVVPARPDTNAAVTAANLSVALGPPATACCPETNLSIKSWHTHCFCCHLPDSFYTAFPARSTARSVKPYKTYDALKEEVRGQLMGTPGMKDRDSWMPDTLTQSSSDPPSRSTTPTGDCRQASAEYAVPRQWKAWRSFWAI